MQITVDILYMVLNGIKNECTKRKNCKGCPYHYEYGQDEDFMTPDFDCRLNSMPCDWDIKKPEGVV